uniref:Uncharacterized protein n=2 Tax=Anopheles albimanus TaxID=7167 RepID=A0A182FMR6_ANOAL
MSQMNANDSHTKIRSDGSSFLNIDITKLCKNTNNSVAQSHSLGNRGTRRIATEKSVNSNARKLKKSLSNLGKHSLMKKNPRKTRTTWESREASPTTISKKSTKSYVKVKKTLRKSLITQKNSKSTLSCSALLKVAGKKKQVSKNNLISKGKVVTKTAAKFRKNKIHLRKLSKNRPRGLCSNLSAESNDKKTVDVTNLADDKDVVAEAKSTQISMQNDKHKSLKLTSISVESNHSLDKDPAKKCRNSRVDKNEIYCNTVLNTTHTGRDPNDLKHKKKYDVICCEVFSEDDNGQAFDSSKSDNLQTKPNESSYALQMSSPHKTRVEEVQQSSSVHLQNSSPPLLDTLKQRFEIEESGVNYISSVSLAVGNQPLAHKRRPKKLNDCIAMLTGKLSERFGVDFFSQSNSSVPFQLSSPLKYSTKGNEMMNIPEKQNSQNNLCEALIEAESNITAFPQIVMEMGESKTYDTPRNNELADLPRNVSLLHLPIRTSREITSLHHTPDKPISPLLKQSVNTSSSIPRTSSKCITKEQKIANHEKSTTSIMTPMDKGYALQLERLNVAQLSEDSDEPLNLCKNNSVWSKNISRASNYTHDMFPTLPQKCQHTSLALNGVVSTMAIPLTPHQQQKLAISHDTRYEHQINNKIINQQRDVRENTLLIGGVPGHNSPSVKPNDGRGNLGSIKLPPGLIIERVECKQSRPIATKEMPSVTIVARNRSPLRTVEKQNLNTLSCSVRNSTITRPQKSHTTNDFSTLVDKPAERSAEILLKANENMLGFSQCKVKQKNPELHANQKQFHLKNNDLSSEIRNVEERACHERGSLIENHISVTITTANRIEPHQVAVCDMEQNSLYQAKNNTMTCPTATDQQNKKVFQCMPINSNTTLSAISRKCPPLIANSALQNHADIPGRATLIIPQVPMPQSLCKRPRRKSFFAALPSRRSPIDSAPVDANPTVTFRNNFENSATSNEPNRKDIGPIDWSPTISGANLIATMSLSLLPSNVFNDSSLGLDFQRLASVRLPSHLKPPEIPPLTIPSLGSVSCMENSYRYRTNTTQPQTNHFTNSDTLLAKTSSLKCSSMSENQKPNIPKKIITALKECSSNLSDEQGSISRSTDINTSPENTMIKNGDVGTARENISISDDNDIRSVIMSDVMHPLEGQVPPSNCCPANDVIKASNSKSLQENNNQSSISAQQPIEHGKQTIESLIKPSTLELRDPKDNIKSIIANIVSEPLLHEPSKELADPQQKKEGSKQLANIVHDKQHSTKVTVIHEQNKVEDNISTQMLAAMSDSVRSSNNNVASTLQKVARKRRKNELASILSDQLLESFKEVDKSKLNDLKLLHDITCQTPDVKFSLEQIPQLAKRKSNPPKPAMFESFVYGTTENEGKPNFPFSSQKSSRSKTPVTKIIWTEQSQIFGKNKSPLNSTNSQRFSIEPINNLIGDSSVKHVAHGEIITTNMTQLNRRPFKRSQKHTNKSVFAIVEQIEKNPTIKQSVDSKEDMHATVTKLKDKSKTIGAVSSKGKKNHRKTIESSIIRGSSNGAVKCKKLSSDKRIAENGISMNFGVESVRSTRKVTGKTEIKNNNETDDQLVNRASLKEGFLREGTASGTSSKLSSALDDIIDSKIQPVRETVSRMTRRKSVFVDRDLAQYMSETKPLDVNCVKDDLNLTLRKDTRRQEDKSLSLINNVVKGTMKPRDPRRRTAQKRLETERCYAIPLQEKQKTDGFQLMSFEPTSTTNNTCNVTNETYSSNHSTCEDIPINTRAREKEKFPVRRILTRTASVLVRIPTPEPAERLSAGGTAFASSTRNDDKLRRISNETKRIYRRRASIYNLPSELSELTEKKASKNSFENFAKQLETNHKESTTNKSCKMTSKGELIRGKCDPLLESLLLKTDANDNREENRGAKKRTTKNSQIAETFSKLFNIQEEIMLIDSTKRKFKKTNNINNASSTKADTNDELQYADQTTVKSQNFFAFASSGNNESQTTQDIKSANETNYGETGSAIYGDSGGDNISPARFVASQNSGRCEYSTNIVQSIALMQPHITCLPYSNKSGRAMSMVDDESTMNTDGMEDDMNVTADTHFKNVAGASARRKRKRLMSVRKGSKIQRQKAKSHTEIGKPVVTYNCDLCKKMFKKQDTYNRHRITLSHIAKLSEQEFLLLQQSAAVPTNHIRPAVYDNSSSEKSLINTVDRNEERKLDKIQQTQTKQEFETATIEDSVKTLSQEEKLFYECCSMLKESNTVDSADQHKLNVTVTLKSIEKGSTAPTLESVNHSSLHASLSRPPIAKLNGNSAINSDSCFQLFHDLKQTPDLRMVDESSKCNRNLITSNDGPNNQAKPVTAGICFLPASHSSNNNFKIKTKGALKGYDNFKISIPMTELMMTVGDETSSVKSDVNYTTAKDSRLETLADIALCSNIPNEFGSIRQSHNEKETEEQREDQITPPDDSILTAKTLAKDQLSPSISFECADAMKNQKALVTHVNRQGRTTNIKCVTKGVVGKNLSMQVNQQNRSLIRTTRIKAENCKKAENCHRKKSRISINAECSTSDADVYAFPDSPCEGFTVPSFTSKKYSTALRLSELSESGAHRQRPKPLCVEHEDSQMSSLSFTDPLDLAYGANMLTDKDEAEESELRKREDEGKNSNYRCAVRSSKIGGKADVKRKCLIMGRIFRKSGNKEKMKDKQRIKEPSNVMIKLDASAASTSVNAAKKDFDKLFDTLKNADDCKSSSKKQLSFPNKNTFKHVRHEKFVEPWDSEEDEDFHNDDILQLLDNAEIAQQQPLTLRFAEDQAPQNSQTDTLDGNLSSRPIDESSDVMLNASSTLGIDVSIDQKCSGLGVVTDYTIRKVMESVILETISKSNQKTINKKKITSLENCVSNDKDSALCREITSIDPFTNTQRSIEELAALEASNEIQSNVPTSIKEHVLESSVLISSRTITTKFKQKLNSSLQRSTINKQHHGQTMNKPNELFGKNEEMTNKALETIKSALLEKPDSQTTTASLKNDGDMAVSTPNQAELYKSSTRGFNRVYKGVIHGSSTPKVVAKKEKNGALKTVFEREKLKKVTANKQRKPHVKKMKNVAYDPDSDFEDNIKCKKVKRKLLENDIEGNLKMEKLKSTLTDNTILLPLPRRKRSAGDMLYYWSSTSDEDEDGQDSKVNVEFELKGIKSSSKTESIGTDVFSNDTRYRATSSRRPQKAKVTASRKKSSKKIQCDSKIFSKSKNSPPTKKSQNIIKSNTCVTYKKKREANKEAHSNGMHDRKNNCLKGMGSFDPSKPDVFDGETSSSSDQLQQHGWIVGDSHKKLVTLLAHAKGKQDSRKTINHRRK